MSKKSRKLYDSIVEVHKQPTLFQLKGVIIVKDFEKAKNMLLESADGNFINKSNALRMLLAKLPGKALMEKNKALCKKIGELSRNCQHAETRELAMEVKAKWKSHYTNVDSMRSEYDALREKNATLLTKKLPSLPKATLTSIEVYIHAKANGKKVSYKSLTRKILTKLTFRPELREKLLNRPSEKDVNKLLRTLV